MAKTRTLVSQEPIKSSRTLVSQEPITSPDWAASEMSNKDKFLAGVGKSFVDIGRGAGQLVGAYSDKDIENKKQLDAPLMNTKMGQAGNLAGSIAAFAPTALIPGANTVAGSALIGSAMGVLQPTGEGDSRLLNTGIGAAGGAVAQKLGNLISGSLSKGMSKLSKDRLKNQVLKTSQEAGYVIPKSEISPTFVSNRLEGLAGKAALKQDATIRNQEVTNSLARKVIGLADDQPITDDAINAYQELVSEPYRQISKLSKEAASKLEKLKQTRSDSKIQWNFYNRSADPKAIKAAKLLDSMANKLEDEIELIAAKYKPSNVMSARTPVGLVDKLREARKLLAKSYTVKRALNPATGDINASVLSKIIKKRDPLSDELKTIGDFGATFPKFSGEASKTPAPGVSKLEGMAAAILAGGGASYYGPEGAVLGGLALLSPVARNALLSKLLQKATVKPKTPSMLIKLLAKPKSQELIRLSIPAMLEQANKMPRGSSEQEEALSQIEQLQGAK